MTNRTNSKKRIDATAHGKLFVFEGLDGTGKTTLSRAFSEYLIRNSVECEYFAFPGREPGTLGNLIYDLHHDPNSLGIQSITPTSRQLLHVAAHIDAIESTILPTLKSGRVVVLDRFWWSTWVYGRVSGADEQLLARMIELEQAAWQKVFPSMVFLVQRKQVELRDCKKVVAEYAKLATIEGRSYPVRILKNERSVADGVSLLVRYAGSAVQFTKTNSSASAGESRRDQLELEFKTSSKRVPLVFTRLSPAKTTIVYETYWRFAYERQQIFFRRLEGSPGPWTEDPILSEYKFTNAYRASDRVSQYLIRHVIYEGDKSSHEVFFRTMLFKLFNKIETWELLTRELEGISFADYSFEHYDRILSQALSDGFSIYSGAYIMPSGGRSATSDRKHRMHLKLLEQMMRDELPSRLTDITSMRNAFELLRSYPTLGDFLAYQYVTDLNYSSLLNFDEMDFVVPGPGARDGIRKCFEDLGGLSESEIIKVVTERQQAEFNRLGLRFRSLWGRPLQLIDCQNLFCEVDKYARIAHPEVCGITGRTRIKQKYRPNPKPLPSWYPPKWGLNELIVCEEKYVSSL